jgi:hypothetical protein
LTGGADEWFAGEIFSVAWLLADEHDARRCTTFAEYSLRRVLVERARPTVGCFLA